MSGGRIYTSSTCAICDRGRLSVSALAELRPGRLICSDCTRDAVEVLVTHYGDAAVFFPSVEPPQVSA